MGRCVERFQQTVHAEGLLVPVDGFRHAVRVDEQAVAGLEGDGRLLILRAGHAAEDEPMAVLHQLKTAVGAAESGELVSRAGGGEDAGTHFEDAEPGGDEHVVGVALAHGPVDVLEDLARGAAVLCPVLEDDLGDHHEQGGRDPFPGDVRHDECQMVIVDEEEVVEVAADFLGRVHGGIQVEFVPFREGREVARQDASLDGVRDVQLTGQALPLGGERLQVVHIVQDGVLHLVDVHGEQFDLVLARRAGGERGLGERVLPGEPHRFRGDFPDGLRDPFPKEPLEEERRQDDSEQGGERNVQKEVVPGALQGLHLLLDAEDGDGLTLVVLDRDEGGDMGAGRRFIGGPENRFHLAPALHEEPVLSGVLVAGGVAPIAGHIGGEVHVLVHRLEEERDVLVVLVGDDDVDERGVHELGDGVETPHGRLVFLGRPVLLIEVRGHVVGLQHLPGEPTDPVAVVRVALIQRAGKLEVADGAGEQGEQQQNDDEGGDEVERQSASHSFQHDASPVVTRWSGCRRNR